MVSTMSTPILRWGILGTGRIAGAFAHGLTVSEFGVLQSVGSRGVESGQAFCKKYGGKSSGDYRSVLLDSEVDAVYIALPHSMHEEWTVACAQAGKGVLCEKPFTLDGLSAEKAIAACRENHVFFAEAFMYRMHPQSRRLFELVDSGVIGEVKQIHAEFGFSVDESWTEFRAQRKEGGGGLMDVGTYCVSMIRRLMGDEPRTCEYRYSPAGDGYDGHGRGLMEFSGNRFATFGCGVHLQLDNGLRIFGTKGRIEVESPWMCRGSIEVFVNGAGESERISEFTGVDLYAREADTVALNWDKKYCEEMSPDDTMNNMKCLDALRASCGLSFN